MSAQLRVVHLATGNLYGGVEVFLHTISRLGVSAGMESEFTVCWGQGRLASELRRAGATVHDLGEVRLSRPWQGWRARRRLAATLQNRKFDVAVVHSGWTHALFGSVVHRARIPLVMGVHTVVPHESRLERWARRIPLAGVFANSRFTAASARGWYPGHAEADVVFLPVEAPPPLDSVERDRIRAELGADVGDCVILQASRMQPGKGIHTLAGALSELSAETAWKAWIVGGSQRPEEKEYEARIHSMVTNAGLGQRVKFLGQRSDVPRLLASADLHVQLNETPEAFGVIFVEAAYAGLPSIAAATGGVAEFIDESCGIRLECGDQSGLARELRQLVRDPDRRQRLGAGGTVRAMSLCDPGLQLKKLKGLLEKAVGPQASLPASRPS